MRTTQRDQGTTITVAGTFDGTLASGSGIARGGGNTLPFTWTRTGVGDYTIQFDAAVTPISMNPSAQSGYGIPYTLAPGALRMFSYNTANTATNLNMLFTLTALDKRR